MFLNPGGGRLQLHAGAVRERPPGRPIHRRRRAGCRRSVGGQDTQNFLCPHPGLDRVATLQRDLDQAGLRAQAGQGSALGDIHRAGGSITRLGLIQSPQPQQRVSFHYMGDRLQAGIGVGPGDRQTLAGQRQSGLGFAAGQGDLAQVAGKAGLAIPIADGSGDTLSLLQPGPGQTEVELVALQARFASAAGNAPR